MSSRLSAKQTPMRSVAAAFLRLSPTRVLVYTEDGDGRLRETHLAPLRYVHTCAGASSKPFRSNITQLFGGSAFTKEYVFGLDDYNKASWFQNFVASIAGASASLVVSAPLDVIKTRIQNRNFENPESGFRILSNMAKNEGFSSFFKGLVPKVSQRCYLAVPTPTSLIIYRTATHDGTEACLLILARPDTHPCIRQYAEVVK